MKPFALSLVATLMFTGCTAPAAKLTDGADVRLATTVDSKAEVTASCTVKDNGNGTYTMKCPTAPVPR